MSEQQEPYRAGEQPAEQTTLGQIAYEEWFRPHRYHATWSDRTAPQRQEWEDMAAAVEAEVLRRAVAMLGVEQGELLAGQGTWYSTAYVEGHLDAVKRLEEYAEQQQKGER